MVWRSGEETFEASRDISFLWRRCVALVFRWFLREMHIGCGIDLFEIDGKNDV